MSAGTCRVEATETVRGDVISCHATRVYNSRAPGRLGDLQIHWNEFSFRELVLSVKNVWREVNSLGMIRKEP